MGDVTLSRFDAAQFLETEDDIRAFLDEAGQDGDPTAIALALGTIARARNISQIARDAGLTRAGVYKALAADGNPSFATVSKIALALGFRLALEPVEAASKTSETFAATKS